MSETPKYGMVERALAGAFGIRHRDVGALRAKVTGLQKDGLLGAKNQPGKGVALAYTPDLMHRLIFACEMFEFGISPSVVLAVVRELWDRRLRKIFERAERAAMVEPGPYGENTGGDIVMHMGGVRLMTDGWANALPNINACELQKLPDHLTVWMTMAPDDPSGLPSRALVTNLTMRLRAFHAVLSDAHTAALVAQRKVEVTAGRTGKRRKRNQGQR